MLRIAAVVGLGILLFAGEASADHARSSVSRPTCLAAYGRIKCGFDCKAGYGRIECAKTPLGVCTKGSGSLACWDPAAGRRSLRRAWRQLRRTNSPARCVAGSGQVACGYNCVARYGRSQCSKTPFGACIAAYGRIECYDPPGAWIPRRRLVSHDRPGCVSAYGRSQCGFGCIAKFGRIQCGKQPGHRCISAYGRIQCGFACVAQYGRIQCAKTPQGMCKAAYGRITCWDPPARVGR